MTPALLLANAKVPPRPGVALLVPPDRAPNERFAELARQLVDVGEERIRGMDADGIDMQLLLLSAPGVQVFDKETAVEMARDANDYLHEAIRAHPTRLAGLAAIAPQDPSAAAEELERSVRRLGLHGAVINSHTNDEYLDAAKYRPIFEAAQALDVPVYIHPREPVAPMNRSFYDSPVLSGAAWAYAVEAGTQALRLIGSGIFDELPKLQIVLGHLGEGIPFWLPRIDNRYLASSRGKPRLPRLPSEYFAAHFHVTTSGMNYWPQLKSVIDVVGIDRVLYATDYPFEQQREAVRQVEEMPLSEDDKTKLFETNAKRVFKISTAPELAASRPRRWPFPTFSWPDSSARSRGP